MDTKTTRHTLFRSFLIGMASVFCPSMIHVSHDFNDSSSDLDNIAGDWKMVGSYISNAYDSIERQNRR